MRAVTTDLLISAPAWVYRLFASDGGLLYVGSTDNLETRLREHRCAVWWHEVTDLDVEALPAIEQARAAEKTAIQTEHPHYNVKLRSPAHPGGIVRRRDEIPTRGRRSA